MNGISIFFLSNRNSCRSQMAEAILRSFDSNLDIYSAGLQPVDHVSPVAIEVMAEVGIDLKPSVPRDFSEFRDIEIDYLITVGEGTLEELKIPKIMFKRKLHLGFRSPYKGAKSQEEIRERCREVRDELMIELDYFYHHIIKRKTSV